MITDKYGQQIYTESDLCNHFLQNPNSLLKKVLVESIINFNPILELENIPLLVEYNPENLTVNQFDEICQSNWEIPESYKNLDIAKFVLDQCDGEAELQRAGEELIMFQERNMFMLLKYLKYLVDTMRENNIVWGVGRGSSVASFVLFLLGVHRINSLHYQLSIDEFLK